MARPYDVCIRGAGIVGRTLALQLAAHNLRVALVETHRLAHANDANTVPPDVRAYALSPASKALLESVRCWPKQEQATAVLSMQVTTQDPGSPGAQVRFEAPSDASSHTPLALNWIVDVPILESLLADAVRFQPRIEVHSQPPVALLTVICEGRASASREEFGVDFSVTRYTQTAVAARVVSSTPHQQTAHQWCANGEILALLPMDGPEGRAYGLVWSVSPTRAQTLLHLGEQAFCEALQASVPPALGEFTLQSARQSWPLQAALAQRWCGANARHTQDTGTPCSWVLAGDAAHTVHPLAGQGLNLGLGDAAELARILTDRPYWRSVSDLGLLRAYARARRAEFARVGGSSDLLQQLFSRPEPLLHTVRDWGMRAFNQSAWLKAQVSRRAMGMAPVCAPIERL